MRWYAHYLLSGEHIWLACNSAHWVTPMKAAVMESQLKPLTSDWKLEGSIHISLPFRPDSVRLQLTHLLRHPLQPHDRYWGPCLRDPREVDSYWCSVLLQGWRMELNLQLTCSSPVQFWFFHLSLASHLEQTFGKCCYVLAAHAKRESRSVI